MDQFQDILNQLFLALLTAAALGIVYLVRLGVKHLTEYLQAKVSATDLEQMKSIADIVVRYLKQSPAYKDWTGEQKKQWAINSFREWAAQRGLSVSYDELDRIIEAAYQAASIYDLDFSDLPETTNVQPSDL